MWYKLEYHPVNVLWDGIRGRGRALSVSQVPFPCPRLLLLLMHSLNVEIPLIQISYQPKVWQLHLKLHMMPVNVYTVSLQRYVKYLRKSGKNKHLHQWQSQNPHQENQNTTFQLSFFLFQVTSDWIVSEHFRIK